MRERERGEEKENEKVNDNTQFLPFSATFDYEENAVYSDLTLIVEDNGITNKRRSIPTPITVRIGNINDEPTVFDQPIYSEYKQLINYIEDAY